MTNLTGKSVLVSGAASGIGAACAELAQARGAEVFAVDHDAAGLTALAERLGVAYEVGDLTDVDQAPALVGRCAAALGGLDGLVNAAGTFQTRAMSDITAADFDRVFGVNVRALFFLQQAAAASMASSGGGSIVNIASTAARVPRPMSSHYAASKAAVVSLTRSASVAWASAGIRANSICPGVIETPMLQGIRRDHARLFSTTPESIAASWRDANPLGRLGRPSEVAELATFLLSDAADYITGESMGINGGTDDI